MPSPLTAECIGIAAAWCPFHGDCTCPEPEGWFIYRESPDCPLHGLASDHPDVRWTADPLDVLRAALSPITER